MKFRFSFYSLMLCSAGLVAAALLNACSRATADSEQVFALHSRYVWPQLQPPQTAAADDSLDFFIDYSSGMYEAMYASLGTWVNDVLTAGKTAKTVFYRAGAAQPYRIDVDAAEHLPTVTTNYKENKSLLDKPLQHITRRNRQAVFITDFEFVPTGEKTFEAETADGRRIKTWINTDAWATPYLEAWFSKGHRLDVWALPFSRQGKVQQYLYVLVFTPAQWENNEQAFYKRLEALEAQSVKHFSFRPARHLAVHPKQYDEANGGLNENLAPLDFLQKENVQFEFYQLALADIEQYLTNEPTAKDKRVLKKVFLEGDLSNFPEAKAEAKVYRLTDVLANFQSAADQPPAEYEVDPETGDSVMVTPPQVGFRYTEGEAVKGAFTTTFNDNTREVGIKLQADYAGSEQAAELFRIDLVLQNARFTPSEEMHRVLQWQDAQGFKVRSLDESITEALRRTDKQAAGRVLRSYYIQLMQ
jgi:hypothetical protein